MKKEYKFCAVIEPARGGGAFVTVPFDVEAIFGAKRVKINAVIGGEPYRGWLVRMGSPNHILPVLKAIREKTGKDIGDEVDITVSEDTEPRVIPVPKDLKEALSKNSAARAFYENLSYTHRREYINWINDAKRAGTRQNRIEKMIELLEKEKRER